MFRILCSEEHYFRGIIHLDKLGDPFPLDKSFS